MVDVAALQQGVRQFELTNHLGNVLSTITDKGVITSAQDYYPFGLTLASRSFTEGGVCIASVSMERRMIRS